MMKNLIRIYSWGILHDKVTKKASAKKIKQVREQKRTIFANDPI
jgi:hypothetical protein